MTESEIQKQIIDYAKASGYIPIRMNSGNSGRHNVKLCPPGTPDLLIVHEYGCLWVEVKDAKGKLRETQAAMHERLKGLCHSVIVARSVDDVKNVLDKKLQPGL